MKQKYTRDFITMIVFVCISLFFLLWAIPTQIDVATWNTGGIYTAQTFPRLIINVMLAVSLLGTINSGYHLFMECKKDRNTPFFPTINWKCSVTVLLVAGIILAYYFLFIQAGYLVATAIMVPAMLLALGCRKSTFWKYLACIYLFSLIIFLIFRFVLLIQVP